MLLKDFFKSLIVGSFGVLLTNDAILAAPVRQRIVRVTDFIAGFQLYYGPET